MKGKHRDLGLTDNGAIAHTSAAAFIMYSFNVFLTNAHSN